MIYRNDLYAVVVGNKIMYKGSYMACKRAQALYLNSKIMKLARN